MDQVLIDTFVIRKELEELEIDNNTLTRYRLTPPFTTITIKMN